MTICAKQKHFRELNECISQATQSITLEKVCGQRFIAAAQKGKHITLYGTPGNALGAYLNGAVIDVYGNAQDAVGDTMNGGAIVVHGNCGDALGYAMRGGAIYVKGDAGYRAGIHMKAYQDKQPVIVIGGCAGSFLGEYMAGGVLIVLNQADAEMPVGNFTGTGMHGGRIMIRCTNRPEDLPEQVSCQKANEKDLADIKPYLESFAGHFQVDVEKIINSTFYLLCPNTTNPYKRLYTINQG